MLNFPVNHGIQINKNFCSLQGITTQWGAKQCKTEQSTIKLKLWNKNKKKSHHQYTIRTDLPTKKNEKSNPEKNELSLIFASHPETPCFPKRPSSECSHSLIYPFRISTTTPFLSTLYFYTMSQNDHFHINM